jgi:hypothetical protein
LKSAPGLSDSLEVLTPTALDGVPDRDSGEFRPVFSVFFTVAGETLLVPSRVLPLTSMSSPTGKPTLTQSAKLKASDISPTSSDSSMLVSFSVSASTPEAQEDTADTLRSCFDLSVT